MNNLNIQYDTVVSKPSFKLLFTASFSILKCLILPVFNPKDTLELLTDIVEWIAGKQLRYLLVDLSEVKEFKLLPVPDYVLTSVQNYLRSVACYQPIKEFHPSLQSLSALFSQWYKVAVFEKYSEAERWLYNQHSTVT